MTDATDFVDCPRCVTEDGRFGILLVSGEIGCWLCGKPGTETRYIPPEGTGRVPTVLAIEYALMDGHAMGIDALEALREKHSGGES